MTRTRGIRRTLTLEALLLLSLLLAGLTLLPVAVYLVGQAIFGDYPGDFAAFYGDLSRRLRAPQAAPWFLVLSPYLIWQTTRLTAWSVRRQRPAPTEQRVEPIVEDYSEV